MEVAFLGGVREIGRSALLIDDRLLVDFGMDSGNPPSFPIEDVDPEAVVVSHGHLDHVGTVPALLSGDARPTVHWTPPTYDLAMTLARDTLDLHGGSYDCPFTEAELARLTQVSETHGYREPFEAAATRSPSTTPDTSPGAHTSSSTTARRACSTPATSTPRTSASSPAPTHGPTPTSSSVRARTPTRAVRLARRSRPPSSRASGRLSGRAAPSSSPPSPSAAPRRCSVSASDTTSSVTSTGWANA